MARNCGALPRTTASRERCGSRSTASGFAEETVRYFEPLKAPWSKGIRTLSAVGDITLVDGMRHSTGKSDRKKDHKRAAKKSRESEHDDLNEL